MSDLRLIRGGRQARQAGLAHVEGEQLALYVIGALDAQAADVVERHVASCEACAEGLAREAQLEAALEQVAVRANERAREETVVPIAAAIRPAERARILASGRLGGRRSRWAGGVGGALAAAAAVVLALASTTAHSEPAAVTGMAQRAPALHDAAGDMSGAFGGEVVRGDSLDGG